MATLVTITVGSGKDYTTIQGAVDGIATEATSADLVTDDEYVEIVVDGGTYAESVVVNESLTTDATRNVVIRAAAGAEHLGEWSAAGGVLVEPTAGGHAFDVYDDFITLQDIEIHPGTGTSDECVRFQSGVQGSGVIRCLLDGSRSGSQGDGFYAGNWDVGQSGNPIFAYDSVFFGFDRAAVHAQPFDGVRNQAFLLVNCAFINNANAIGWDDGSASTVIEWDVYNCYALANSKDYGTTSTSSSTPTFTGSNNLTADITSGERIPGATFCASRDTSDLPLTAGDWIGVVDADLTSTATLDYTPLDDANNNILGGGVGPSSNSLVLTTDIAGNTRSGATCDVGPYDLTSENAGPSGTTGSGAPSLAGAASSGSGTVSVTGSGAVSLGGPAADGAGTATLEVIGSGDAALAGPQAIGAGTVSVTGSGSPSIGGFMTSGSGEVGETGSGGPSLSAPTASGVGLVSVESGDSNVVTLSGPTASGAGTVEEAVADGTGSPSLGGPTASGTGAVSITGSGAVTLSGPLCSGGSDGAESGSSSSISASLSMVSVAYFTSGGTEIVDGTQEADGAEYAVVTATILDTLGSPVPNAQIRVLQDAATFDRSMELVHDQQIPSAPDEGQVSYTNSSGVATVRVTTLTGDVPRKLDVFAAEDQPEFLLNIQRPTADAVGRRISTTSTEAAPVTIDQPGAYERVRFEGLVTVLADGVVFQDCEFDVAAAGGSNCLRIAGEGNVVFARCTFTGSTGAAIRGRGFTLSRCLVEDTGGPGVQVVYQGDQFETRIFQSLIRKVGAETPSPCILLNPGAAVRIQGCALEGWSESSAQGDPAYAGRGAVHAFTTKPQISYDAVIERCWLEGGDDYIVRVESVDNGNPPSAFRIVGNRFGDPAQYGGASELNLEGVGHTVFGNISGVTGRLLEINEIPGAFTFPVDAEALNTQATVVFIPREAPKALISRVFPLPSAYNPTTTGITGVHSARVIALGQVYDPSPLGARTDEVATGTTSLIGWAAFRDAIPTARLAPPQSIPQQTPSVQIVGFNSDDLFISISENSVDRALRIEARNGDGQLTDVPTAVEITLNYGGTATRGVDYTAPDTATIDAGASSTTIAINPDFDAETEGNETIIIEIDSASSAQVSEARAQSVVTLTDEDYNFGEAVLATTVVNFGVTLRTITEGQGTTFRVRRTRSTGYETIVNYTVLPGTLSTSEYTDVDGGQVTIPAGEESTVIRITTSDDAVIEQSEEVQIRLDSVTTGSGSGGFLVPVLGEVTVATLVVEDDDTPPTQSVGWNRTAIPIVENATDGVSLLIPQASSQDISVSYTLTEGAGLTSSEYALTNFYTGQEIASPITIPAGETQVPIRITSIDDTTPEANETLTLELTAVTAGPAVIDPAAATTVITFLDNDNGGGTNADGDLYGLAPERTELDLSTADMEIRSGEYEIFANAGLGISGSVVSTGNPVSMGMRAAVTVWEAKNAGNIAALQAVSGRLDEGEVVKIRLSGDLVAHGHSLGTVDLPLGGDSREVYWNDYPYVRDICLFGETGPGTDIIGAGGINISNNAALVMPAGDYVGRRRLSANMRYENLTIEGSEGGQRCWGAVGSASNSDGKEAVHGKLKFYDCEFAAPRDVSPSSGNGAFGIKWNIRCQLPATWDIRGCISDLSQEHFLYINAPQDECYIIQCRNRPFRLYSPNVPEGYPRTFTQIVDRPVSEPCSPGDAKIVWLRNTITNGNGADLTVTGNRGEMYMVDNQHIGDATGQRGVCEIWSAPFWDIQGIRRYTSNGVDYTGNTVHIWNERANFNTNSTSRSIFNISGCKAIDVRGFDIAGALGGFQFRIDRTSSREFLNGEPAFGSGHGWFWDLREDGIVGDPIQVPASQYSGFQQTSSPFQAKMLSERNCAWHFVSTGFGTDRHILTDQEIDNYDGSVTWGGPTGFPEAKWSVRTIGLPVGASTTLYYGDEAFSRSRYEQTIGYTRTVTNLAESAFDETLETPGIVEQFGGGTSGLMTFTYMDEATNDDGDTPDERPAFTIEAVAGPTVSANDGFIRYEITDATNAEIVSALADVYFYDPASFGTFEWQTPTVTLSLSNPPPYDFYVVTSRATQMSETITISLNGATSTNATVVNYGSRQMPQGATTSQRFRFVDPQNLAAGDTIVIDLQSITVDGITAGNIGANSQLTVNVVA